jgi:hypothetical protein
MGDDPTAMPAARPPVKTARLNTPGLRPPETKKTGTKPGFFFYQE